MEISLFLHITIGNMHVLDLVEAMFCQKLLNWRFTTKFFMFIELAMQKHSIYWNEFNLHVSCLIVVQNMMHNKIVQKITLFLQRMSDKELHRRLVTGTINTCSVTAKTVTMLSTNAQKSITQAKVWLLFEKRYC